MRLGESYFLEVEFSPHLLTYVSIGKAEKQMHSPVMIQFNYFSWAYRSQLIFLKFINFGILPSRARNLWLLFLKWNKTPGEILLLPQLFQCASKWWVSMLAKFLWSDPIWMNPKHSQIGPLLPSHIWLSNIPAKSRLLLSLRNHRPKALNLIYGIRYKQAQGTSIPLFITDTFSLSSN